MSERRLRCRSRETAPARDGEPTSRSSRLRVKVSDSDPAVSQNRATHPIVFEQALHSYFAVSNIAAVGISGLTGTTYIDKTEAGRREQETELLVTEVDPVWWSPSGFQRRLHRCPRHVRHTHPSFAVRWSSWSARAE
jgi:D-hexose-6-phosphate mutarotase